MEYVLGGVDITLMRRSTARTDPLSYPQGTESTRTGALATVRASDTGERFTACDTDTSKPVGFICQLMSDTVPGSIRSAHNLALKIDVPTPTSILGEAPCLHGIREGTRQPETQA